MAGAVPPGGRPGISALELLLDRAGNVNESFEWDDDARAAAVEICRSLDGIPLAIELAAAQLGALAPRELLERLDNRFELLVGGRTRRRQRQQTLQAVMQWSWELLSDDERTVLRELSVFAGGWTLEAAEAVLARPGRPAVAGVLRSLVWKSLIEPVAGTSGRHRMFETVRLFAQERLAESGSAAEARDRHASWFVEWTQRQPTPKKLFSFDWLVEFRNDLDNIASAITWSVERSPVDRTPAMLVADGAGLWLTGVMATQVVDWTHRILEEELDPIVRARLCVGGFHAAILAGEHARSAEWTKLMRS